MELNPKLVFLQSPPLLEVSPSYEFSSLHGSMAAQRQGLPGTLSVLSVEMLRFSKQTGCVSTWWRYCTLQGEPRLQLWSIYQLGMLSQQLPSQPQGALEVCGREGCGEKPLCTELWLCLRSALLLDSLECWQNNLTNHDNTSLTEVL